MQSSTTSSSQFQCSNLPVPRRALFDIGGGDLQKLYLCLLYKLLVKPANGKPRSIPAAILSNDRGMEIWHDITILPKYYQTRDEIALLKQNCSKLAELIPSNASLIDLGDFTKIKPLLDKLEELQKPVKYFALDLSQACLQRGILSLNYKHVKCRGLWGTFDDALEFVQMLTGPRWFLSLGSMFGNDHFELAVARLSEWASIMQSDDRMLIGMDACKDKDVVWNSYHDSKGTFEAFMRNGLEYTNQVFGHEWYRPEDWEIIGFLQDEPFKHRFVFRASRDIECPELELYMERGTEIDCYEAFKYAPDTMQQQFARAGLQELYRWQSPSSRIFEYLLSPVTRK